MSAEGASSEQLPPSTSAPEPRPEPAAPPSTTGILVSATMTVEESTAKCPFWCVPRGSSSRPSQKTVSTPCRQEGGAHASEACGSVSSSCLSSCAARSADARRIPFSRTRSVMVVLDAHRRQALPAGCKMRQMVPTAGLISTAVFEAPDVETVKNFLEALVGEYCTVACAAVTVDQAFNLPSAPLSEQAGAAADRVASTMSGLDQKYHIRDNVRGAAGKAASAAGKAASAAGDAFRGAKESAMQNETISTGVEKVSAGFSALATRAKALGSKVADAARSRSASAAPNAAAADEPIEAEAPATS